MSPAAALPDVLFRCCPAGGSVLRSSESHRAKVALYSLFGVPLWYFSQSPRAAIQPDVQPGNCWAFSGAAGVLVLRLAARIRPTSFSLEHLPRALAPTGESLSSAPRDFSVYVSRARPLR